MFCEGFCESLQEPGLIHDHLPVFLEDGVEERQYPSRAAHPEDLQGVCVLHQPGDVVGCHEVKGDAI